MKRLTKEHCFYVFDKSRKPELFVQQGESFQLETLDCRGGRLLKHEDVISTAPDWFGGELRTNPCTGPVYVQGLRAGDTLCVRVEDIQVSDRGFIILKTDMGIAKRMVDETKAVFATISGDEICLETGVRLPLRPHIGTLGVCSNSSIPTGQAGSHGGNLDARELEKGALIFLPCEVDGALLAAGDVHASMGKGELMGTGVEIGSVVTLSARSANTVDVRLPVIFQNDTVTVIGTADQLQEALEKAAAELVRLLIKYGIVNCDQEPVSYGMSVDEALSLLTAYSDAGICQGFDQEIFSVASVCISSKRLPVFANIERSTEHENCNFSNEG